MPDQVAAAVVDETEQSRIRQVELLVRQPLGHLQPALLDLGGGDQRIGIGRQALLDDPLEGQAESALQNRQQDQHEQRGQACGAEHQTQTQRHRTAQTGSYARLQPAPASTHRQRSVNR